MPRARLCLVTLGAVIVLARTASAAETGTEPDPEPTDAPREPDTRPDPDRPAAAPEQPGPAEEHYWSAIPPRQAAVEEPEEAYWAHILAADGAALALGWYLHDNQANGLLIITPYLLASPIVHGFHGNLGRAGVSLLLRVGLPIVGALVAITLTQKECVSPQDGGDCLDFGPASAGLAAGAIAAMALDAGWLARPDTRTTAPSSRSVTPVVSLAGTNGPTFGLAGTF